MQHEEKIKALIESILDDLHILEEYVGQEPEVEQAADKLRDLAAKLDLADDLSFR